MASDCISISELKKSPSQIIKSLARDKKKFIFVNNKPKAMILDFELCEQLGITDEFVEFGIVDKNTLSTEMQERLKEAEKIPLSDYVKL